MHNSGPCDPFRLGYKLKQGIDLDWRKSGKTYKDALDEAFNILENKYGAKRSDFEVTDWGHTKDDKTIPVEYRSGNLEANIDYSHSTEGTLAAPHVGYLNKTKGNKMVGHIILDEVPSGRISKKKYE